MQRRLLDLPNTYSFFLFGARGVGKSTLLSQKLSEVDTLWIDLLDPEQDDYLARDPKALQNMVEAKDPQVPVVIDEVQKQPKLLDVVHSILARQSRQFIM